MHDGAVVIKGNKIIAAGVLLPLTEDPKLSWKYGTRHRAAIGMSENSDAVVIVVSEETGQISVAMNGVLTRDYTREKLKDLLCREIIESRQDLITANKKQASSFRERRKKK